jgi:hypothetical protein
MFLQNHKKMNFLDIMQGVSEAQKSIMPAAIQNRSAQYGFATNFSHSADKNDNL